MVAGLNAVRYLTLLVGLMQYAFARIPQHHYRQEDDHICFYYAVGNVLQEEIMDLDTLRNLNTHFVTETRKEALIYKNKEETIIDTLKEQHASEFLNFMLRYQGYQGGKRDDSAPRHIGHYDLVPDAAEDGFLMYHNEHTQRDHQFSDDDIKAWFDMPHFKGFIIKQKWSTEWSHYSCIARNGKHWFYIENYFSIMDRITTEDWNCPAAPNGRDLHALLPKRDLDYQWESHGGEYRWNAKECSYSEAHIRYLHSRYLGVDNYNGIHRMKQMIASEIGTAEWFKPVFDSTNLGNLKWWTKHFGVAKLDKTSRSGEFASNRNMWPLHALESLRLSYVWCQANNYAFWNRGGYIRDETTTTKTCNLKKRALDPSTYRPGKSYIKRALLAEFNRKVGNCGVDWNVPDFSSWHSGYAHADD